jgi:hypothetical protein
VNVEAGGRCRRAFDGYPHSERASIARVRDKPRAHSERSPSCGVSGRHRARTAWRAWPMLPGAASQAAVAFASAARSVPDRWPGLGVPNRLGQQLFAGRWIAVEQPCHPRPRNVPIASSIWAMGHHPPAPIEQPDPQLIAQACLNGQPHATFNLDDAGSDSRLAATTRQPSPALVARQRANPVADRLKSVHVKILALPPWFRSRALWGPPYVRCRTDTNLRRRQVAGAGGPHLGHRGPAARHRTAASTAATVSRSRRARFYFTSLDCMVRYRTDGLERARFCTLPYRRLGAARLV